MATTTCKYENTKEVTRALAAREITAEQADVYIDILTPKAKLSKVTFKVSEKAKAVQINGLTGRWPLTLYVKHLERFLSDEVQSDLSAFLKAEGHKLSRKC